MKSSKDEVKYLLYLQRTSHAVFPATYCDSSEIIARLSSFFELVTAVILHPQYLNSALWFVEPLLLFLLLLFYMEYQ